MAENLLDVRVQRSKNAVLAETYRLLTQAGLSGVSIDDVARNSGVAKTTIYRHWPSRSALLIDACSRMGGPLPVPDTGTLRGDLRVLAGTVAEQLRSAAWPSVLPSIIDAAERDPEIAAMQSALHAGNVAPFRAVFARATERGEIPTGANADDAIATILGPLFYRRWFSKETIDDRLVDRLVELAVVAATHAGAPEPEQVRSRTGKAMKTGRPSRR